MLRFVTIAKFAAESGYTEKAIRGKIYDGTWNQGEVWGEGARQPNPH